MATLQERLNAAKKDTRPSGMGVKMPTGSLQDRLNAAKQDTGSSFSVGSWGGAAKEEKQTFSTAGTQRNVLEMPSRKGGIQAITADTGSAFVGDRGSAGGGRSSVVGALETSTQNYEARLKELGEIEADLKAFEMATQYAPANQRPVKDIGGFTSSQAAREEYNRVMAEYAALLKENGKTDSDFGRNVRYALEKGGAGFSAAVEGLEDAAAMAMADERVGKALKKASPAVGLAQDLNKLFTQLGIQPEEYTFDALADKMLSANPSQDRLQDIESRYAPSKAGQVAGEVAQGVGGMVPSIAANAVLPGSGMAVLGVQAAGQSGQQALNEGATLEQAVNYGVLSGGLEAATEAMFGGLAGLGKGFLNTAAGKGVGKLIAKLGTSKAGQVLSALAANPFVKALGDSLGEGVEEGVSAVLSPYLARLTYDKDAETATVDEVLHDVFIGALTGGVFQGVGAVANAIGGQKNTAPRVEAESTAMQTADGGTQALDANGPGNTPNASLASSLSAADSTVPQPETDVNGITPEQARFREWVFAEGRRQAAKRAAAAQGGAQESVLDTGKVTAAPGQVAPQNASQNQKPKVKMSPGVTDMRRRVLSKRELDEVRNIERLAKAAGVSVYIVEDMPEKENGRYENGELYLSAWAEDPLMQVAKHEVTHHLQEVAPELYAQYRGQVERILSERGDLEDAVQARMQRYAEAGQTLDYEAALDEAAADFTEELLLDENLFRRLAQEDRSLAQRILDGLKDLLARLKKTLSRGEVSKLEQASGAWEAALKEVSAQKNTATASGAVKYSLKRDEGGLYVSVDVDQHLFDGMTTEQMQTAAKKAIVDRFKGKVIGQDYTVYVNKRGAEHYAYPANRRMDDQQKRDKMRASTELDNLITASTFRENVPDDGRHPEATGGLDKLDTRFLVNGRMYEAEVTVLVTDRGRVFYDVTKFKDIARREVGQTQNRAAETPNNVSEDSILRSAEKSNSKSSLAGVKELERQMADLRKQNERLQAQNDRLKGQMKRSGAARTDEAEVKRTAGGLLKDFGSRYGREQLADRLQKLYDSMANPSGPNSMTESEMRREAQNIAKDILSEVAVLNDDMYREYSDLRNYLRTTKIHVPQELWGDLDSEGGYNEFRKRNMGRLSLSSTEGRGIDDVYQELSYDYPGLFDQDAVSHPADQLAQMAEIAGNLRPTYENPYAADRAAMDWLAGEIMERFYDLPQQKGTFADRAAARVDEVRQQERRAAQERLQKELKKQEERYQKKIANIKESNRQAGKRMRENMSATKLRDTIKRHAEGLSRKLLRPTDKQRIPERLRGSVLALLEVIDLESKYAYEFTRDATFKRVNRDEAIGEGEPTTRTSAARALKAAYEELRSDPEFNGTVDPDLADKLEEIAKMGDVRLADMGREQLQTVWEAVRAVEASVTKSDKMLGASKYGKISTAAEKMRAEMGSRKDRKNLVGALGKADRLLNLDMLSPETFLHRLGAVGEDIHRQMRRAQDKNVEILREGVEFYRKAAEETEVDLLKAEKEMHTFKLPGGTIELTTAQVMDLYALSKRKAAMEHIYKGGLRTQGGRKGLVETGKSKAVKVTMMDVADILEVLTPEQKKLVDKLQEYMSTRLAAHGNEASMEAYDYEKFKERAYWPIKVSKTETDTDPASEARAKTIPGFGMTKALQPHANNSVMLRSALDSFGEHLNQMATYAAWLTTSENITKLVNYDFVEGNARTGTVKDLLLKVYGKGGEQYLTKLLSDVAQGTKTGSGEGALTDSMFGRWKGAKVGANIRVILQQPTAILRAAEMIDAKYMAQTGNPVKGWQKALEWSPIAQWKDWGYFEMDAGRSMRELMAGTRNVLDKTRNAAMAPAGKMDNMAWGMLWNAVEAETKAKHRDLKVGSDEYYRAVAERFGDVVDRTQVVDSVLHRTQIMRSSNALNRMATSFMSEPSKIYNMVARDIYDIANSERGSEANKRAWKHVARTGVALTASFAVNAVAQSIADALRDDDRDKEYLEKFGDAYVENFFQNFDPLGYLPYVKDVESIVQGFTVDRSDMEGLADLAQAAKTLVKALDGSGNKTVLNAGMETLNKALDAMGLPASNIKRDVMAILSTVLQATGAHELTYNVDKLMLDIRKSGNAGVYYDTLYRAMNDDYDAYVKIYNDMVASGMDPEKIVSGMEKRMARALNLSSALMLPVDYYAPGKNKQFDQLLKKQQSAGKTWVDSVDPAQVELAYQLEDIKSEAGANERRMRAIADSDYDESVKERSMERVMSVTAYDKYMAARDAKISTYDYMNLLDDIKAATLERRGESGNASQDDIIKALRQSGLTAAQKRAVWYSYGYKSESPWG